VICAGVLLVLDAGLAGGLIEGRGSVEYARTLAFNTLVLYELVDVFCIRSDERSAIHDLWRNAWLWAAAAGGLALQLSVIYAPPLQRAFGTVALGVSDWLLCAAVAATIFIAREAGKAWWRAVDRRRARRLGLRLEH
jgi:Ca2+-transporting ATPase